MLSIVGENLFILLEAQTLPPTKGMEVGTFEMPTDEGVTMCTFALSTGEGVSLPSNKELVADIIELPSGEGVVLPSNKGKEADRFDIIELPSGEGVVLPSNKGKEADRIDLPTGKGTEANSFVVSTTTVLCSFEVGADTFELPSGKELGADTFGVATTLLPRDLGSTNGGGSSCRVAIEAVAMHARRFWYLGTEFFFF